MNRFLPGRLLPTLGLALIVTTAAHGQSRREERAKAEKMARIDAEIAKRRSEAPIPEEGTVGMNGEDLRKKRELEIIQARLGNNTLGADKENQYEDQTNSGFTVRKWKPAKGHRKEERGYAPPAGGIDPPGQPLVKEQRKFFFGQK